jgi:hypothetical protein
MGKTPEKSMRAKCDKVRQFPKLGTPLSDKDKQQLAEMLGQDKIGQAAVAQKVKNSSSHTAQLRV